MKDSPGQVGPSLICYNVIGGRILVVVPRNESRKRAENVAAGCGLDDEESRVSWMGAANEPILLYFRSRCQRDLLHFEFLCSWTCG